MSLEVRRTRGGTIEEIRRRISWKRNRFQLSTGGRVRRCYP